jgi:hypothetical protein
MAPVEVNNLMFYVIYYIFQCDTSILIPAFIIILIYILYVYKFININA